MAGGHKLDSMIVVQCSPLHSLETWRASVSLDCGAPIDGSRFELPTKTLGYAPLQGLKIPCDGVRDVCRPRIENSFCVDTFSFGPWTLGPARSPTLKTNKEPLKQGPLQRPRFRHICSGPIEDPTAAAGRMPICRYP